jgi:uncharacterized damage-inducible protein DinB
LQKTDEYAEFYGAYISRVPDGDLRSHLRTQMHETIALLSAVPDAKAEKAYGAGKWTLKEVILHMSDAERVFNYRMLRIARNDQTPLAAFDENAWVPHSCANARSVASLVMEFAAVRGATLAMIDSLPDAAWEQKGTASGHTISARALAYICAGHEAHHLAIIRERYLTA